MKKHVLFFLLAIATTLFAQAQHSVTINVDMSNVADFDTTTRELDWAGAIDGWAAFHPLSYAGDSTYSVTFTDVPSGFYGGDVYHNDKGAPDWGTYGEWSGAPTGIDIMIYVGDSDVVVNTKWGETYDLTVSVDMNDVADFDATTDSVYLLSPEVPKIHQTPMLDNDGDGVYTVTLQGIPSGYFPILFGYGPDVDNIIPEWDYNTNKGKRVVVVDGADTNVSFVFSPQEIQLHSVTINVDMSGVSDFDPATRELDWAGAFDGWAAFHPLSQTGDNIYSVTFNNISPGYYGGDVYHNDKGAPAWGTYGEWSGAPTGIDIMVYVGDSDVVVNTKWGETYALTVNVDMNNVPGFDASSDSVFLISPEVRFNNTPMLDDNADGIYSVTLQGIPSGYFPILFGYGSDVDHLTPEWDYDTHKGDRVVRVDGADTTVSFVFTPLIEPTQSVTINVDMSGVADFDSTTQQLDWAGDFDGWAAFHTLTKTGDNIYSVTFDNVKTGYYAGDVYWNDKGSPAWGTYGEWSGALTGIDIMVYVADSDVVVNTKWGETYDLTVNVDMSNVSGFDASSDSVFLLSPQLPKINQTVMTDDDGDGVYTVILQGLPTGYFPILFGYGTDVNNLTAEWDYDAHKGDRVVVLDGTSIFVSYVFSVKEPVATDVKDVGEVNVQIYPNPSDGNIVLSADRDYSSEVYNISGQVIRTIPIYKGKNIIDLTDQPAGLYFIRMRNGLKSRTFKVVVR